ncbi:MAG TPA: MotA/TolQ/ExbB proton channel family protein [Nevskia sp.]|nr:MotA/TolQ/ExbB proton channel family protein [Nevskia sp.]
MSMRTGFKKLLPAALLAAGLLLPAMAGADGNVETVSNPYGLDALWKGGDFVARFVLVLMLIMSAGTWYIMIMKVIDQSRLFQQHKQANQKFWSAGSVRDGLGQLKSGSAFWYVAERGSAASQHHEGTMVEQIDLSTWITLSVNRAVEEIQSKLQGGLAVLATVGSTAPFVGLFGTVWGIYHALTAIGIAGQASIDKVAGPVGEALIMTAIGLAVAVPAVMGYNWLVRRNKNAMDKVRAFSSDLHSVLLSGARVGEQVRNAAAVPHAASRVRAAAV